MAFYHGLARPHIHQPHQVSEGRGKESVLRQHAGQGLACLSENVVDCLVVDGASDLGGEPQNGAYSVEQAEGELNFFGHEESVPQWNNLMNSSSIASTATKFKYKIIFLGDQSVGKTAIIDRYIRDQFG